MLASFERSTITNLSLEEAAPARFVRTARLSHQGPGDLEYTIRQITQLAAGRVTRQVNEELDRSSPDHAA